MAKNSSASAFDEILTRFGNDEDRETFKTLAEKNPALKEYGLRQSDYSRFMNEKQEDLAELNQWREWRQNNWIDEKQMTKGQLAVLDEAETLRQQKTDLERQVLEGTLGGSEVDFAQLEQWGTDWMKKNNIVTSSDIQGKEKELKEYVDGNLRASASASIDIPYLNQKHQQEFGELFDPQEFLKEAVAKQRWNLRDYYENDFVTTKRKEALDGKYQSEIKRLTEEKDAEVAKAKQDADEREARLKGMGQGGMSPTDGDGPRMGHLQKQMLGMETKPAEGEKQAPEVPIGDGGIAAFAARQLRENQLAGRS